MKNISKGKIVYKKNIKIKEEIKECKIEINYIKISFCYKYNNFKKKEYIKSNIPLKII